MRKYKCKICGRTFGTRRLIREHIRTEHKKTWRADLEFAKREQRAEYLDKPRQTRPHLSDYYTAVVSEG